MLLNGAFNELRINLRQDVLPDRISKLVSTLHSHDAAGQPGKLGNLKCPLPNFVRPDYQEPGWRHFLQYARVVPCPAAKMRMQAGQTLFFEEALFGRVLEYFGPHPPFRYFPPKRVRLLAEAHRMIHV